MSPDFESPGFASDFESDFESGRSAEVVSPSPALSPGVGFRGLAPPSVVGHVEFGFSREGPAIYVGLDYPF